MSIFILFQFAQFIIPYLCGRLFTEAGCVCGWEKLIMLESAICCGVLPGFNGLKNAEKTDCLVANSRTRHP